MNKVNIDQIKQQFLRTFYKLNDVNHWMYTRICFAKSEHKDTLKGFRMCGFVAFQCRLRLELGAFVSVDLPFIWLMEPTQEQAL